MGNDDSVKRVGEHRLGRHARSCRKARGLTQEVLAERSGLASDTIRRLEQGAFSPSFDTLRKVCAGLDLSLSTFFESYDLGERNVLREFTDTLDFLTPEEQRLLFQFLAVLRARFGRDDD